MVNSDNAQKENKEEVNGSKYANKSEGGKKNPKIDGVAESIKDKIKSIKPEEAEEYAEKGIDKAEELALQEKLNRAVEYLDNPENTKITAVINKIRKFWDTLPGVVQGHIIHNYIVNDPIHLVLRGLAKTGILKYKREKKPQDTKTMNKTTIKIGKWAIKAFEYYLKYKGKELDVDERYLDSIFKVFTYGDDKLYQAKLHLEEQRELSNEQYNMAA